MDTLPSSKEAASNQTIPQWIVSYGWIVAASFVISQPFHHLFELPVAFMAGIGLWLLISHTRSVLAAPAFKPLFIMFACIWLPMLFSLTDAVNFPRAAQTTLVFLRFPLMAIFIFFALQDMISRNRLLMTTGIALSLAVLWVFVLAVLGHSSDGRVLGIPFPIGQFIGVMSPILFFWATIVGEKRPWIWLIFSLSGAAMIFTGSRASWIMFAIAFSLFLLQVRIEKSRSLLKSMLIPILLLSLGLGFAIHSPTMKEKISQTAGLFSGDYEKANQASSLRFPIWAVAARIAKDHWINGIGPRGFRYIYPDYVLKDDYWLRMDPKHGPTHPHQFFLEVAAESGGIGLLGYMFALLYWIQLGIKASQNKLHDALPWIAAVFVAIMPINAHMAFYASFWSCITWWLLAVSLACWQISPKLIPRSTVYTN
jgi:O-antigen ligase